MDWNLDEAITYYKSQGAPKDQTALISLLLEIQQNHGGSIPLFLLTQVAQAYAVKQSFLLAVIKRIPSLRLDNTHCLELCAGPNCSKQAALAAYAEKLHKESGRKFDLKFSPCMRMCGKGPNVKWDGVLYNKATPELLEKLISQICTNS